MGKKKRLAGRFLPSRVYARWKWTVRFGLWAVPLILFLTGSLVLYFTPSRYQSSVLFEYLGKRPPAEAAALLKSRNVVDLATATLKLRDLMAVDSDSLFEIVSRSTRTEVDQATGMIELKVTNTRNEVARDLAVELVKSLEIYETTLAARTSESRLTALSRSLRDAEDYQEEMRKTLVNVIRANGEPPENSLERLNVDEARRNWDSAQSQCLELAARATEVRFEMENPAKWVSVHSQPRISSNSLPPKESLGDIILQSLGTGLAFALILPYLAELALPRRLRSRLPEDEWSEEPSGTQLPELAV